MRVCIVILLSHASKKSVGFNDISNTIKDTESRLISFSDKCMDTEALLLGPRATMCVDM
jgi:hypothetical protein